MNPFKLLLKLFLLPGSLVLHMIGISIEEDGGMVRSFVNMVFWGALALGFALKYYV